MYQTTLVRKQVAEIQGDLSESFLERRITEHKHSPEEELQDVVQHLMRREAQLGELADSATKLLEQIDELEGELEEKQRESAAAIRAQQTADHELNLCTEMLANAEEKVDRLSKLLEETEKSRDDLSFDLHHATKSLQQAERSGEPSRDSLEIRWEEARVLLELRCQDLESTVQSFSHEREIRNAAIGKMEKEMGELRDARDSARAKVIRLREKLRNQEAQTANLTQKLAQSEETIKFLEFDLSIAKKKVEKLEEDLSVATDLQRDESLHNSMMGYHERHGSAKTFIEQDSFSSEDGEIAAKPNNARKDLSLTLRDDILQDEELFLGRHADMSPKTNGKHFTFAAMMDIIARVEEVCIWGEERPLAKSPPQKARYSHVPQRKDPGEEFFILAVQAIKLNSPFMDDICTEAPQQLYARALERNVPFHQWYPWIEERLRDVYLQIAAQKGGTMEILAVESATKSKRKK